MLHKSRASNKIFQMKSSCNNIYFVIKQLIYVSIIIYFRYQCINYGFAKYQFLHVYDPTRRSRYGKGLNIVHGLTFCIMTWQPPTKGPLSASWGSRWANSVGRALKTNLVPSQHQSKNPW